VLEHRGQDTYKQQMGCGRWYVRPPGGDKGTALSAYGAQIHISPLRTCWLVRCYNNTRSINTKPKYSTISASTSGSNPTLVKPTLISG
jgi:hypothetical protein